MNFYKRIICVVALVFLSTAIPSSNLDISASESYSDIDDYKFQLIEKLNLIEKEKLSSDEAFVTRAQTAVIAEKLIKLDGIYNDTQQIYDDVAVNHSSFSSINNVSQVLVMSGTEKKLFSPDKPVTIQEFIKVMVCVTGYEHLAVQKGGYPTGFIIAAIERNIIDSSFEIESFDAELPYKMAALILYQAINTDISIPKAFGSKTSYYVDEGKTLLTERFNIYRYSGIVEQSEWSTLAGASGIGAKEVVIDGFKYGKGDTDAEKYLGYSVIYYVVKNDRVKPYIFFIHYDKNLVTEIDTNDIQWLDRKAIKYSDKNSKSDKSIRLAGTVSVIYNGMAYADFQLNSESIPYNGKLTAIDNNADGAFDVLFIWVKEIFVVDSVNAESGVIRDKIKGGLVKISTVTDLDNSDIKSEIHFLGEKVAISELMEWDVLEIFRSPVIDSTVKIQIYAGDSKVYGTVSGIEKSTFADRQKITIDSNEYIVDIGIADKIELNDSGIFLLDSENRVVFYDFTSGANMPSYGLLQNISLDQSVESKLSFRIFTKKNTWEIFTNAKNMLLDGAKVSPDNMAMQLDTKLTEAFIVVRYEVNRNNEITEMATVGSDPDINIIQTGNMDNMQYNSNERSMNSSYFIDNNVVMFRVSNIQKKPDYSEDSYAVISTGNIYNEWWYDITLYNVKGTIKIPECIVIVDDTTAPNNDAPVVIVDYIATVGGEDGTLVEKLYGYSGGNAVSVLGFEQDTFSKHNLKSGDIVRLGYINKSVAKNVSLECKISDVVADSWLGVHSGNRGSDYEKIAGVVADIQNSFISVEAGGDNVVSYIGNNPRYAVYDYTNRKIRPATKAEVDVGSKLFIQRKKGEVKDVIIFQ